MKVPAEPAQAPCGDTYTTIGTVALSIAWMMSLVAETRPPGVSSSRISATAPSAALCAIAAWMKSDEAGLIEPAMRIAFR